MTSPASHDSPFAHDGPLRAERIDVSVRGDGPDRIVVWCARFTLSGDGIAAKLGTVYGAGEEARIAAAIKAVLERVDFNSGR